MGLMPHCRCPCAACSMQCCGDQACQVQPSYTKMRSSPVSRCALLLSQWNAASCVLLADSSCTVWQVFLVPTLTDVAACAGHCLKWEMRVMVKEAW